MAFTVIQVGAGLHMLAEDGTTSPLTLPTGVTLRQNTFPRWTLFDRYAVLVNTPDQPLIVDANGVVRLLSPRAPRSGAVLTGVNAGGLTGTYAHVRYTFVTQDLEGNVISESDYSPESNSVSITSKLLRASNLDVSADSVTGRRLYRPTNGGAVLFQWVDLDGNVLTTIEDDLSDASLSIIAAPTLGTPPYLTHIASFRGRLFGSGPDDLDHVRYTEAGIRYAWPSDNLLEIPVIGSDDQGVTAFLQRREALGVGRVNQLVQITGTGAEDTNVGSIDFDVVIVSKELGILAQESVDVYRDIGYFLWHDGVYEWEPNGITCVSDGQDGKGQVRSWFATDNYFDRDRFNEAFGMVDPVRNKYRLFLYDPEGAVWWVEFDIKDRTWWGPHKTNLFTPSSAFIVQVGNLRVPMIGSRVGSLYREQEARVDGTSTAIPFDVIGKRHDYKEPDIEKYFGDVTIIGAGDQSAGHVSVISRTGELNDAQGTFQTKTQYYDLRKSRHNLGRLGVGKHSQLQLTHATANQKVELYGYDIDDVHVIGKR